MVRVTKTTRGWSSPAKYYQGPGEIDKLPSYTELFGKKVFAVIDPFFYKDLTARLEKAYAGTGSEIKTFQYEFEVTDERIKKISDSMKDYAPQVVIGIGGGKTLDTAKGVADDLDAATIIVPTAASTDAPAIGLSVIYTEEHEHVRARFYVNDPDIVLVDSQIIADAPVRFLVSGMGDALSTVFEARANIKSDSANFVNAQAGGFRSTKSGRMIAELCYDILMANGIKALYAAQNHVVTEALEDVIEANVLMSGLGVENNGCAGAHSICEGISILPELDVKTMHGEKVGFGTLCQMILENTPDDLIDEVIDFCGQIGLPLTLDDLFIPNTDENVRAIAKHSFHSYWEREPFLVTEDDVFAAIKATDQMGREYRETYNIEPAYTRR